MLFHKSIGQRDTTFQRHLHTAPASQLFCSYWLPWFCYLVTIILRFIIASPCLSEIVFLLNTVAEPCCRLAANVWYRACTALPICCGLDTILQHDCGGLHLTSDISKFVCQDAQQPFTRIVDWCSLRHQLHHANANMCKCMYRKILRQLQDCSAQTVKQQYRQLC